MAKKKSDNPVAAQVPADEALIRRPRLNKLIVRNFRAIGNEPVTVELDDIVVLVGPNNCGKSSILRAYQVVMLHGSKDGELTQEDFPNAQVDPQRPVEIELETVVYDEAAPGAKWIRKEMNGDMVVREKWTWASPGKPKKIGWDVAADAWAEEGGPWGAAGVAQIGRPEPHRIEAFDPPEKQAAEVLKLLKEVLNERIKAMQQAKAEAVEGEVPPPNDYQKLLGYISEFQKKVVHDANEQIGKVEDEMNKLIGQVFPGNVVRFDARPEEDLEDCLNFFKDTPQLLMGPADGYQHSVEKQGSGARRTLLWAALRLIKEQARSKKDSASARPHLLLLDEPELCLHPDAVREACRVLYDLPSTGSWQVMLTTHSPVFIDFWRDNTSIVRVSRSANGTSAGTTIYRPKRALLDEDDKQRLKLLNLCDPYMAEFFFGGKTVLVEGDTEHTAFTYIMQQNPDRYKGVHVIRARGKATIVSLCKILNQFGAPYAVLHDSDTPTAQRKGQTIANPAWAQNINILGQVTAFLAAKKVRLIASIPSFEPAYCGYEISTDKPTAAWEHLKQDANSRKKVEDLLDALTDFNKPLPDGAFEWNNIGALLSHYQERATT